MRCTSRTEAFAADARAAGAWQQALYVIAKKKQLSELSLFCDFNLPRFLDSALNRKGLEL
jgi:hypothetical protein